MRHYCTYFDKNYLDKGLCLHSSLCRYEQNFTLWIMCLDAETMMVLKNLHLENIRLMGLSDLENADPELRSVRDTRGRVEYYWTCTAPLLRYIMNKEKGIDILTYLDADIYFYSSPEPLFDELEDNSILITEHRFSEDRKYAEPSCGKYNVSFLVFKNNDTSRKCIDWWRERCLESCDIDNDKGVCGDQKYLDEWPALFGEVKSLEHKGGGLAPWNVADCCVSRKNGKVFIDDAELVFYHFHQFKPAGRFIFETAHGYKFRKNVIKHIYIPYGRENARQWGRLRNSGFNPKPLFVDESDESSFSKILDGNLVFSYDPRYWFFR